MSVNEYMKRYGKQRRKQEQERKLQLGIPLRSPRKKKANMLPKEIVKSILKFQKLGISKSKNAQIHHTSSYVVQCIIDAQ